MFHAIYPQNWILRLEESLGHWSSTLLEFKMNSLKDSWRWVTGKGVQWSWLLSLLINPLVNQSIFLHLFIIYITWPNIVIHQILLKTLPGTGSLVEWTVTMFYLFILILRICVLRTCYTKQETTVLGNSNWILYLDIWQHVYSTAITSLSTAEPLLLSIIAVQKPVVPLLVFLKRAPRVCETSVTLLSSLCRNGLSVLLNGRDYLWQRFSQCQFVHRGKYSSKGMFFSGCQTQLPLAVTSITCVTVAFSGPLQHGAELLSSITSQSTLLTLFPLL